MRSTWVFVPSLLVLCAVAFSACGDDPVGPPGVVIPADTETIVYSKHIQPIFSNGCAGSGCHLGNDNFAGLKLDTWEHVMEGGTDYGAEVIPYNAAKSHLFQHINADSTVAPIATPRMPLGRDPLPANQIATIKRWIEEGARNDAGEVALAAEGRARVYVTCQADDYVAAIDLSTERLMRYVGVGTVNGGAPESPHNIVLSPDGRYFYVNLIVAGFVEKYDAHTFAKLGTVRVGASPAQVAVTHDGSTLYVSNFDLTLNQRYIVRVDAATMAVTDTIFDVGAAPHGVTLSPDETHVYTTNALGDEVAEIDTKTLEVTRRIPIVPDAPLGSGAKAKFEPYQSEITPDGRFLWLTCRAGGEVRVVDLTAGRVVDSITVGATPLILKTTPNGKELWVPNRSANTVSVIDMTSRAVVATITGIETQPHAVAFTADGRTAFVSCENTTGNQHHPTSGASRVPGKVYVVDVVTRTVRRTIEVGAFAAGIAVGG